jgi:hypothetical protein
MKRTKRRTYRRSHTVVNATNFTDSLVSFLSQNRTIAYPKAKRAHIRTDTTNTTKKSIGPKKLFIGPNI